MMVLRVCAICGIEFDAKGKSITCSPAHSKIKRRQYLAEYGTVNREAHNQRLKKWREKNPEKVKEQHKRANATDRCKNRRKIYRDENREKINQQNLTSYYKNRDANIEKMREWREQNPEKITSYRVKHYLENRDLIIPKQIENQRKRRIRRELIEFNFAVAQLMKETAKCQAPITIFPFNSLQNGFLSASRMQKAISLRQAAFLLN